MQFFSVLCQAAIAGKREEKFCYSFFFYKQARKSFKPDGLLVSYLTLAGAEEIENNAFRMRVLGHKNEKYDDGINDTVIFC